jgi:hypothetical protein
LKGKTDANKLELDGLERKIGKVPEVPAEKFLRLNSNKEHDYLE